MLARSCGVLYIATREPYLSEAVRSARSVRDQHPDLPITLYAPTDVDPPAVFDDHRSLEDPAHGFSDSNLTREHMPYDRNLFLDTDTYVCDDLEPVFALLDRFDIAASQDPTRTGTAGHTHDHDVPEAFPQYNTGVIAYRDTEGVRGLFDEWCELYQTVDGVRYGLNQPTFRMAAYESDLDIGTLPPEYNFRLGNVANSVNYACGPVRIIHGRSCWWTLEDLAERINATTERRVIIAKPRPIEVITQGDRSVAQRAAHGVDRKSWEFAQVGVVGAIRALGGRVKGVASL